LGISINLYNVLKTGGLNIPDEEYRKLLDKYMGRF